MSIPKNTEIIYPFPDALLDASFVREYFFSMGRDYFKEVLTNPLNNIYLSPFGKISLHSSLEALSHYKASIDKDLLRKPKEKSNYQFPDRLIPIKEVKESHAQYKSRAAFDYFLQETGLRLYPKRKGGDLRLISLHDLCDAIHSLKTTTPTSTL